jgi:glucose-6-phosphate isomerase
MPVDIQFNYDNALEERVGPEGLTTAHFDKRAAAAAVNAFRARVESGEVGFPELPEDQGTARAAEEFAAGMRSQIDHVLLVGIGGSALGAYALDAAIRGRHPAQQGGGPRLIVLDNIDPGFVAAALECANPKRSAVCVVAKSGSTAETLSTFLIVRDWLVRSLGRKARERIIAITDAGKGDLLAVAKEEKYPLFFIPGNVGGRFSVLSPVGLVPAALVGINIGQLLKGAQDATELCWRKEPARNPALAAALLHWALDRQRAKHIEVVFAYSSFLWGMAFWYRQLWAESLGKQLDRGGRMVHNGQTPVAALGVTDQHSQLQLYMEGPHDKMVTFWEVRKPRADLKVPRDFSPYDSFQYLGGKSLGTLFRAERLATEAALTQAARPNCRWTLPRVDAYNLGAFLQMLEFQTAFAGELYGVDAFNQPGVELGKKMTYGLMGRPGYEEFARMIET